MTNPSNRILVIIGDILMFEAISVFIRDCRFQEENATDSKVLSKTPIE